MRYHPTPVRLAVIKKTIMKSVSEDVEKNQPSCAVRGNVEWHNQNGKKICKFLIKLKQNYHVTQKFNFWVLTKEKENINSESYMHPPNVHCSFIYISKDMEAAYVVTDEGMDKENMACIYNGICCSVKSCLTLCNRMDCSMPGSSLPHHLPEFAQIHAHRVSDAI